MRRTLAALALAPLCALALAGCGGHSGSYIDGYNYGVGWIGSSGFGGSFAGAQPQSTAISQCTEASVQQEPPGDTGSDWIKGCTDAETSGAKTLLHP